MNGQINLRDLWRWRLVRAFESFGRTGWLGLAAVILAIILAIALLRGTIEKTRALEHEVKELQQGKSDTPQSAGSSASLLSLLPEANASIEFPAFLHQVSSRQSVRIDRMEYQLQKEVGKPLLLYRVDLVGIAPYLKLRSWLDEVLKERPTVAIDELIFERPNADLDEVTARIRLTFYMKGDA